MTTNPNLSATTSQAVEDDGPELEAVVRMYAAAKAGLALLEAVELEAEVSDELADAVKVTRAVYDRLAKTQQRTGT